MADRPQIPPSDLLRIVANYLEKVSETKAEEFKHAHKMIEIALSYGKITEDQGDDIESQLTQVDQILIDSQRSFAAGQAALRKAQQLVREAREQAAREQFGFPSGSGSGQGQTGTPGNQGDPAGNPDAGQLDGLTRGTGDVGGGLSDRGVVDRPNVRDNTQKTGVVRINICVDRNGNVIGVPEYTQRGSTTSDNHLVQLSIENARKFRFKPESMAPDRQCGHITFTYRVN